MSKQTILGESQITPSPHDVISIELVEPDGLPAFVKVAWPQQPSAIDPERFRDLAAALVKMFSEAHVTLARVKARRYH